MLLFISFLKMVLRKKSGKNEMIKLLVFVMNIWVKVVKSGSVLVSVMVSKVRSGVNIRRVML